MTDLHQQIEALTPALLKIRRDLHRHPELSEQEVRTSARICSCLDEWGIPYKNNIAGHGVIALVEGKGISGKTPKTVAVRADIDALPVSEPSTHICCSENPGVMHACGHDAHTTIALGLAKVFKDMEDTLPGNVKFLFQPAEETVGGAKPMVACGCMEEPHVDYVLGLHVMPDHEVGTIEYRYGKLNAASDDIRIFVHGKSCHGAYPEQGIDAIVIASHIVCALQTLVSRTISPLQSAVLSFGCIEGGRRPNIICDEVTLHGTLRTTDARMRTDALAYIEKQASLIARAFGGSAELIFEHGYNALINNNEVVDVVLKNAEQLLGRENLHQKEFPSLGVEDFSFFLDEAPGAFFHLGCGNRQKGMTAALHSKEFELDERCIPIGIELQAANILSLLNNNIATDC